MFGEVIGPIEPPSPSRLSTGDAFTPPSGFVADLNRLGGATVQPIEWVCKGPNGGGVVHCRIDGLDAYIVWVRESGQVASAGLVGGGTGHWERVKNVLSQEQMAQLCQQSAGVAPGTFGGGTVTGGVVTPGVSTSTPITGALPGCYYSTSDGKKWRCTVAGRQSAYNHARRLAGTSQQVQYVLYNNGSAVTVDRAVTPAEALTPSTSVAATTATTGLCPTGYTQTVGAGGQVLCVQTQPAAAAPAAARRGRTGGRRGRTSGRRGRGGLRDWLGDAAADAIERAYLRERQAAGRAEARVAAAAERAQARIAARTESQVRKLQYLLRRLGVTDYQRAPLRVSGELTPETVQAVNHYLVAAGQRSANMPASGMEILIGMDALLDRLAADVAQMTPGKLPDIPMSGCPSCGLGDAALVERNLVRYGGPNIPSWMLRQNIPNATFAAPSVVQPDLATYRCPPGYFPTVRGCVAYSAFTSGTGFPRTSRSEAVQRSLLPWNLGPDLPGWMLNEQVPPGGSVWASK